MAESLRPRFRYYVPYSPDQLNEKFRAIYSDQSIPFTGTALKYHIVVDFLQKDRKFWTPQLDLNLEKYEEGTLIRGLLGPRPNVWTIFMFFYAVAGFIGIIGVIVGLGQWGMEGPPLALWLLPLSGIIFGVVYYLGITGKKIAHNQSVQLHNFLVQELKEYTELELEDL